MSIDQAIFKDTPHVPYLSTSSVLESSFRQVYGISNPEADPSKLLPLLLDQLVVLGQTAQQLKQALGNNGHRQDQVAELLQLCAEAKKDLEECGVSYEEISTEGNPKAIEEVKRLSNGTGIVPIVVSGDEVKVGFSGG